MPDDSGNATDAEVSAAIGSSPTAQGEDPDTAPSGGPASAADLLHAAITGTGSAIPATGPIPQPGDQSVDIDGNPLPAAPPAPGTALGPPGSTSVAARGITDKGRAAVAKAYAGADVSAETAQRTQLNADELAQKKRVTDNDSAARAAADEHARLEGEHDARIADLTEQQAQLTRDYARSDERSKIAGIAAGKQYRDAAEQQMAAVRQMSIDPTSPISTMTSGQFAGLSLASFAQGFLNARYGIKVDVSGQIDKWVDNSIKAQQANIQNARAGAEDQLHLYEIARQTSNDEDEARTRYHAMVVSAMQGSIAAEGARYNSGLAASNAAAMNAQLDGIRNDKLQKIEMGAADRVEKANQLAELSKFHQASLAVEWAKYNAMKPPKPAPAVKPKKELYQYIADPEDPTGKAKWAIRKDNPEAVKNAMAASVQTRKLDQDLAILQKAHDEAFGAAGGDPQVLLGEGSKFAREKVRLFNEARTHYANDVVTLSNSKRYSTEHMNNIKATVPGEFAWAQGNNNEMYAAAREHNRSMFQDEMDTYASNPDEHGEGEQETGVGGRGQIAMPREYEREESGKLMHGVRNPGITGNTAVDAETKPAVEGVGRLLDEPTPMWHKLMAGAQTEAAAHVDSLAVGLADPVRFREIAKEKGDTLETVPTSNHALRAQIEQGLRATAVDSHDPQARAYARRVLETFDMGGDPDNRQGIDALKKMLGVDVSMTGE